MASRAIKIYGVKDTTRALYEVMRRTKRNIPRTLKWTGEETIRQARKFCPIDTGALRQSIHTKTIKEGPDTFQENVKVGKEDVKRGEGAFAYSTKTGQKVSPQPTTQYAEIVEIKKKFMETARQWADGKTFRNLLSMVIRILKITI